MNVTVISFFRNATSYIERYFDQMGALAKLLVARGDKLALLLGYGDSTDDTHTMLVREAMFFLHAHLVDVSHGGPVFGSIEDPQRFKQLAGMGNKILQHVDDSADVVGIVESDLIWDAETMVRLIDHIQHYVAVAPMVMDGPESFYDVFAFRADGKRFTKEPPYHRCFDRHERLYQLDSAGSVLFMDAHLARKARFSDGESIVGFCRQITWHGGSIWLDPQASCAHPPYGGVEGHKPRAQRDSQHVRL